VPVPDTEQDKRKEYGCNYGFLIHNASSNFIAKVYCHPSGYLSGHLRLL
jgi:hypothetical protein